MTLEELACLILPGDISGLLRRGSPAIYPNGQQVTVLSINLEIAVPEWRGVSVYNGASDHREKPPIEALSLDLTDPTGRAHAAWWLGDHHEAGSYPPDQGRPTWASYDNGWLLSTVGEDFLYLDAKRCPVLADLNPDDTRLLPDGSRWVDAEALRRVCLHVAGREII